MDHEQPAPQQDRAQAPGAARKARVRRLRRRAIAISAVCFVLFLGVITVRMASGEDPVLGGGESSGESGGTTSSAEQFPESSEPSGEGPEGFLFEEGGSGSAPVMPESLHSGQS